MYAFVYLETSHVFIIPNVILFSTGLLLLFKFLITSLTSSVEVFIIFIRHIRSKKVLDEEDVFADHPDEKSIITGYLL